MWKEKEKVRKKSQDDQERQTDESRVLGERGKWGRLDRVEKRVGIWGMSRSKPSPARGPVDANTEDSN